MWIVSKGNEGRSGHAGLGLLTSLSTRSSSSAEIKLEYDIDETQTIALLPSTYIDNLRHKRLLCSAFNRQLPLFPRTRDPKNPSIKIAPLNTSPRGRRKLPSNPKLYNKAKTIQ